MISMVILNENFFPVLPKTITLTESCGNAETEHFLKHLSLSNPFQIEVSFFGQTEAHDQVLDNLKDKKWYT